VKEPIPTNLQILRPSRKQPKVGDIFVCSPSIGTITTTSLWNDLSRAALKGRRTARSERGKLVMLPISTAGFYEAAFPYSFPYGSGDLQLSY
jgi:hypothetical protein